MGHKKHHSSAPVHHAAAKVYGNGTGTCNNTNGKRSGPFEGMNYATNSYGTTYTYACPDSKVTTFTSLDGKRKETINYDSKLNGKPYQ